MTLPTITAIVLSSLLLQQTSPTPPPSRPTTGTPGSSGGGFVPPSSPAVAPATGSNSSALGSSGINRPAAPIAPAGGTPSASSGGGVSSSLSGGAPPAAPAASLSATLQAVSGAPSQSAPATPAPAVSGLPRSQASPPTNGSLGSPITPAAGPASTGSNGNSGVVGPAASPATPNGSGTNGSGTNGSGTNGSGTNGSGTNGQGTTGGFSAPALSNQGALRPAPNQATPFSGSPTPSPAAARPNGFGQGAVTPSTQADLQPLQPAPSQPSTNQSGLSQSGLSPSGTGQPLPNQSLGSRTLQSPPPSGVSSRIGSPADTAPLQPAASTMQSGTPQLSGSAASPAFRNDLATSQNQTRNVPETPSDSTMSRLLVSQALSEARTQAEATYPLPLVDAISRSTDPEQRKEVIRRYWQLSVAAMDLAHAKSESAALARIANPPDAIQQAALAASQAIARARLAETELAWRMTQRDLMELINQNPTEGSPFPVDSPFIGRYKTNLSTYAQADRLPEALRRIDLSLPWMLETIHARGEAVIALQSEFDNLGSQYQTGRAAIHDLLLAFDRLRDQRLAFLATTRDYNRLIAEYALTVAPGGMSSEAVVSMLVKEPTRSAARDPNVRRTGWEEPAFDAWQSISR